MLFKTEFLPGIIDGSITLTFRSWIRPQARVGGRYRVQDRGFIVVDSIRRVRPGEITTSDARRAGFADSAALLRVAGANGRSELYRVAFHYAGTDDARAKLAADSGLSAAGVEQLTKRLGAIDARSATGPWTRATLALIAERPGTVSTELATRMGMERPVFKTNVRRLKALGLTISLERGYELSPRGKAFLRAMRPTAEPHHP